MQWCRLAAGISSHAHALLSLHWLGASVYNTFHTYPLLCGGFASFLLGTSAMGVGRESDASKLRFTLAALAQSDPSQQAVQLEPDVLRALDWMAARTPEQAMKDREQIISELEARAAYHWYASLCMCRLPGWVSPPSFCRSSGACDRWKAECASKSVGAVSETVCGSLLHEPDLGSGHGGMHAETFRRGAPLLPRTLHVPGVVCVLLQGQRFTGIWSVRKWRMFLQLQAALTICGASVTTATLNFCAL